MSIHYLEYKCGGVGCHKYSICDYVTLKCKCPEIEKNAPRQPVCGTDYQVYSSLNALHRKSCMENSKLDLLAYDGCDDISKWVLYKLFVI